MKSQQCPECGNELQEQAVFCTTCGRDLASLHEVGRHRLLLFGTPISLLVIGIALAWDIGETSPVESGMDLGMILGLVYVAGAIGQWLAAVISGREPDSASAWRGGVYAVVLLPVTVLIGMPLQQYLVADGRPGVTLADEPYLRLGMDFCIYIIMYSLGILGAAGRLPLARGVPGEIPVPGLAADDGLSVLIGRGRAARPDSRIPGMARLTGLALCVAALLLAVLPASSRLVVQARFAAMLGRQELALSWAKEALARNPGDASAHHLGGVLMLARSRDADSKAEALSHLRSAVRSAPGSARYHLTLGMELNRLGFASEAIGVASEAVALHSGEYRLWMLLADVLTAQDRRPEAVAAYRKALELEPRDPVVPNNLAFTLLELGRDLPLALELAKTSVELQPGYVYNMDTLAWALHKNGRSNEALEIMLQIREAVATLPAEIEFHNAVICREIDLLDSPRAVFERIAARADIDAVPGLKRQVESVLETLPLQAESGPASETASATIAPPGGEGR